MSQAQSHARHSGSQVATLAGGCFWCLEAALERLRGVEQVVPGYSGGTMADPSYEQVSSGRTGHAESVQITFDPAQISFEELLDVFFSIHDPTTPNRQGADVGTQYRSAIFYHSQQQRDTAERVMRELEAANRWHGPIVTELTPMTAFYPAEDYHRRYFERNAEQPYCRVVIEPKLVKLREQHADRLKGQP